MNQEISEPHSQQLPQADKELPLLSVVVCTYNPKNYLNLKEAVDSLVHQSYRVTEIIVVVDGVQTLADKISTAYTDNENVKVIKTERGLSITQARNVGIRAATGDIVAFTDDDAVPEKNWLACLVDTYQKTDAVAVGGKILPLWLSGKPAHLPAELYWLVGVTHDGFAEERVIEVRDAFGPNMSFKRVVFETVGYFNENLGFSGRRTSYIQGEEPEFGLRIKKGLGRGVMYNPNAVVYHKVPQAKLKFGVLLNRSFYQGYSKALIQKIASSGALNTERSYLKNLFSRSTRSRTTKQTAVLLLCVLAVGLGFIYGRIKVK